MRRGRRSAGFTLTEAVLVLSVTALLAGTLAPVVKGTTDRARLLRASTDAAAIRDSVLALLTDTRRTRIRTHGQSGDVVRLLVTDGDVPRELAGVGNRRWQAKVDNATGLVDFVERHLLTNVPGGDPTRAWRLPQSLGGRGWRGGYLQAPIGSDPWGNRFGVNVQFLNTRPSVIVLSAGPDEVIDTAFELNGLVAGGDDIVVLIEA